MSIRNIVAWLVAGLALLVVGRVPAAAPVDLDKLDRRLAREPAYVGKPGYCLLVFGPQANTKVWLVLDGVDLYADLNANGDLAEDGERFLPQNRRNFKNAQGGYRDWEYQLGDVKPVGATAKHTRFEITAYQVADGPLCHVISVWVNDAVQQYAGWGAMFEPRLEDAPVIHFGAPVICRTLRSDSVHRARFQEIHLCFGTPGIGKHSFAYVGYETLPKALQPQLEIEWPTEGGEPARTKAALDGRC